MKRIEDIQSMEIDELLEEAAKQSVSIPSGLKQSVESALMAESAKEDVNGRGELPHLRFALAGGLVLACMALGLFFPRTIKDTYSDPSLAYAELEKTFAYISQKVDRGMDIASEAGPVMSVTSEMFNELIK